MANMKNATISQAKDRFSEYLQLVERGETVLILRRDKPIARIVPIEAKDSRDSQAHRLAELERLGVLRRARRKPARGWYARLPKAPMVPDNVDVVSVLIEQRGDR
jgi:prevent-host-death family protein